MTVTNLGDAPTPMADGQLKLRVNVLDALMAVKGIRTREGQAEAVGISRTHWVKIRSGEVVPNLETAMRVAQAAGTTVEVLFGRES